MESLIGLIGFIGFVDGKNYGLRRNLQGIMNYAL